MARVADVQCGDGTDRGGAGGATERARAKGMPTPASKRILNNSEQGQVWNAFGVWGLGFRVSDSFEGPAEHIRAKSVPAKIGTVHRTRFQMAGRFRVWCLVLNLETRVISEGESLAELKQKLLWPPETAK